MNWSNRSKVVAGFCAVGGVYGIWRLLSDEKNPLEYKKRNDIEEEDIDSEDENIKVEDRAKTGHGDQLRSSPDDVHIDQLLHLLRVSLPQYQFNPKSENNILIAIHELILKSRYFNNIEEMLDSGRVLESYRPRIPGQIEPEKAIVPLLSSCLETENEAIISKTCELINNLSTCNAGLSLCSSLVPTIILLLESYLQNETVHILQSLFITLRKDFNLNFILHNGIHAQTGSFHRKLLF